MQHCKIASVPRNWINCVPHRAVTTFAFSSVFILLLCMYIVHCTVYSIYTSKLCLWKSQPLLFCSNWTSSLFRHWWRGRRACPTWTSRCSSASTPSPPTAPTASRAGWAGSRYTRKNMLSHVQCCLDKLQFLAVSYKNLGFSISINTYFFGDRTNYFSL